MKYLNMKEAVRMLSAFIEYANNTRKYHDVGNYEFIARCIKEADKSLEAKDKLLDDSIPKENVMNLARMIRADQEEANENENFGEATVLGEVFDQIVKLLTNNKENGE